MCPAYAFYMIYVTNFDCVLGRCLLFISICKHHYDEWLYNLFFNVSFQLALHVSNYILATWIPFCCTAPFMWFWVPETMLSWRQLYWAFTCESIDSVSQVKVDSAWLFITLIEQSKEQISLFLWVSLTHSFQVGFAKLILTSDTHFCFKILNVGLTWHWPHLKLSWLRKLSCLYELKLSHRLGLPYLPRWDSSPTRVFSPIETGLGSSHKRWLSFAKK